jgi:hypothetical protein
MSELFDEYFEDWEVRPDFSREYISLWPGWLGDRHHLLDEVTEEEWSRFNSLASAISKDFRVGIARCSSETVDFPEVIDPLLSGYKESTRKDASQFSKFVIPDLRCVITEEWDYTYILWHKSDGAVDALKPYILASKLHHFSD